MYASPIAFEPALMDFKSQPLSMPVRRRVVVKNLSPESSIEMLSISGNTANFHCSFFQEKRISPGGNTTFDIVYLGRERGLVENILFIHTSLGSFKYQVSAIGKENPYRLRPFIGVRMPLNSSYTPLIYMHNPHSSTIQLTEIYTSGGDLHLEMPDGENKISKELWEIPPYKTKPVMKANFVSRIEKNHTAFIRIKLNSTIRVDLILPVEVEVVSLPGIFSPTETLDFGVMHSQDEPKTLPLNLLNSGPKQLYISRLHHAVNNESFLDFGTLGIGNKRSMFFVVINENPIEVVIKHWGTNMTKTLVELAAEAENSSTLVGNYNFSSVVRKVTLLPLHYALFRVSITAPETEGVFWGEASIETNHEVLKVQFTMRTAKGSLMSDPIVFENAFPGKVSSQNLYIHSTFSHSMTVTSVQIVPEDSRFYFEVTQNASPVLQPRSKNWVGKLYFDPRRECKQECYSGLPTATTEGRQWLSGLSLPSDVGDADLEIFQSIRTRWLALQEGRQHIVNVTLKVDTSEAQGFLMEAQVLFHWPKLSTKNILKFPVTQVGNLTPSPDNVFLAYGKGLEEYFHAQRHRRSLAFQLTPGMRVRMKVGFSPKDDQPAASLLLIRNNLTVMSAVMLKGQGGYGQLRLGNKVPGANDAALTFELLESHLKDCDGTRIGRLSQPNFTVRRGFTARNTGQLPVFVRGFYISGKPCQGYGFRVLDCHGFELKPNATRRIDIAFTPDFMLSLVEHTLELQTSLGRDRVAYKMSATVPRQYLGLCQASMPRPRWEPFMQCCALSAALFLVLCALAYAYLERDRILHTSFYPLTTLTDQGAVAHPTGKLQAFDLRSLAAGPSSQGVVADGQSYSASYSKAPSNSRRKNHDMQQQHVGPCRVDSSCQVSTSRSSTSLSRTPDAENHATRDPDTDRGMSRNGVRRRTNAKQKQETGVQASLTPGRSESPVRAKQTVPASLLVKKSVDERNDTQQAAWWKLVMWFNTDAWSKERSVEAVASVATQTARENQVIAGEKKDDDRKNRRKKMVIEEETSSTTTETSNADSDLSEKASLLKAVPRVCASCSLLVCVCGHDGRREAFSCRSTKRSSGSMAESSNQSSFGAPLFPPDGNLADESFEASTKPKTHKKSKIERKRVHDEEAIRQSFRRCICSLQTGGGAGYDSKPISGWGTYGSPEPRRLEPALLTPVPQRTSRRLRGEQPEFGALFDSSRPVEDVSSRAPAMATQATSFPSHIVMDLPRIPEVFHGDIFEDSEDWLDGVERVARLNGLNEDRKLRYVFVALQDSARAWFENHEASLLSWDDFRREFLATYPNMDRKEKAEVALQTRNQQNNESVAMYIVDMSRLFRRANPNMAEEKKLRHLMRGVKEEPIAGLVRNPPRSLAEFRSEATMIEKTLQQRPCQYNRDVSVSSVSAVSTTLTSNIDLLHEMVRAVVREELQKIQMTQAHPAMSSLADVVREEVRQAVLQPQPQVLQRAQPEPPPQLSYCKLYDRTSGA
ncbi:hypothetical protein HPB51_001171 [Rhipicephalus microplus]|uniref:Transmembrane protein n=1 Tax=Rhipicephalus microplus TaxID=6941 RepID=A0A9J6DR73_RHIMP|nr:hypothetical protein HPB51_001171 [Rhipicephalus microplus]